MQRRPFLTRAPAAVFLSLIGFMGFAGNTLAASPGEARAEIQKMRSATLERLYKVHPAARADVQKAAGYAVFSNVGINLILLSAAGGSGGAAAGAITVAPGVNLYQLTENGLALQATIQGTKYFKNDELNGK